MNLGKVKVKVNISTGLVNVKQGAISVGSAAGSNVTQAPPSETFELRASEDGRAIMSNTECPPKNLSIASDSGGNFAVMYPTKRYWQINNYLDSYQGSGSPPASYVIWNQCDCKRTNLPEYLRTLIKTDTTHGDNNMDYSSTNNYSATYKGPIWEINYVGKEPYNVAHDVRSAGAGVSGYSGYKVLGLASPAAPTAAVSTPIPTDYLLDSGIAILSQTNAADYSWWGVRTSGLSLGKNVPFYLDINRSQAKSKTDQASFLLIRISNVAGSVTIANGDIGNKDCTFDLVWVNGQRPRLYDWAHKDPLDTNGEFPMSRDLNGPILSDGAASYRIGFMPVCGKLEVSFNDNPDMYARIRPTSATPPISVDPSTNPTSQQPLAKEFDAEDFVFQATTVEVWGGDCTATVAIHAMAFGESSFAVPQMNGYTVQNGGSVEQTGDWFGLSNPENLAKIPQAGFQSHDHSSGAPSYGSNCSWGVSSANITPSSDPGLPAGYKPGGWVGFKQYPDTAEAVNPQLKGKTYMAKMLPTHAAFSPFDSTETLPILSPFLQRIRGERVNTGMSSSSTSLVGYAGVSNVEDYVMSFTETYSTPDRYHVEHTVDLTLYNPKGVFNELMNYCRGIEIWVGWDGDDQAMNYQKVFTGATYGGVCSKVAGKEVLIVHCEDYMAVLDHCRLMNSPFYDGMDAFDAILDLGLRAGITALDDSDTGQRYYLPSGYSWTEPRYRFAMSSSLKDDMVEVCKLCEKMVYFDANGALRFTDLQGGIFGDFTGDPPTSNTFYRVPKSGDASNNNVWNVILDEQKVEFKLMSTVNSIFIRSTDRKSGMPLVVTRNVDTNAYAGLQNRFPYRKQLVLETPVLASLRAANYYIDMLKKRLFQVPKAINFRTLTRNVALKPTDIIKIVDDTENYSGTSLFSTSFTTQKFRVMSIARNFDAESNSFDTNISGEWYGS